MTIIAVEEISFDKFSNCLFLVKNSKGKSFGILPNCSLCLNDKDSDVDSILNFFKSTRRTIAEMRFPENGDYHPNYINFMALE